MVDVAPARVGTDHQTGHPQAIALAVHSRRLDVVVEPAPVIPGQEDRRRAPVLAGHDRVDHPRGVILAGADPGRRVLRVIAGGDHPRNGRQVPTIGVAEQLRIGHDVAQLPVLVDVDEIGQRVPDLRRLHVLGHRLAGHRSAGAIGLSALSQVVAPADLVLVQQIGDLGPPVVGRLRCRERVVLIRDLGQTQERGRAVAAGRRLTVGVGLHEVRRLAAHRPHHVHAVGRPGGHHVQVRRQAPAQIGLEHVVLEHEVLGVLPVVRDLPGVVITHDVKARRPPEDSPQLILGGDRHVAAEPVGIDMQRLDAGDEPVHRPVADIGHRVHRHVRPAVIDVLVIVVGLLAAVLLRVRHARQPARVPG